MRVVERVWLPSAATVPQECGPDYLAAVEGADWSEGQGVHRGFFSSFRIRAGRDVWLHMPFPTPIERDGVPLLLSGVSLLWEALDGARIHWLVLQHGGMERVPLSTRLEEPPSTPVAFEPPVLWRSYYPDVARRLTDITLSPPLPLRFGVQLCILVAAPDADATIRIYGAGAAFSMMT